MNFEQRANLKFLVKLGKTPTESLVMMQQVYGEDAMGRTQLFQWHKKSSMEISWIPKTKESKNVEVSNQGAVNSVL
jgi:hypothetical protein